MSRGLEEDVLRSLRRITRALDLYSKELAAKCGLTGPQLVCLRALGQHGPSTPTALAEHVDSSPATMTGILDRLEAAGLVVRRRAGDDRRRVTVTMTRRGAKLLAEAPSPLQERLRVSLHALPIEEQCSISDTLSRVVRLMGALPAAGPQGPHTSAARVGPADPGLMRGSPHLKRAAEEEQ